MVDPKATRFWQQALQSGLIDPAALQACWGRVPESKRTPEAAERRLARQAVDAGYLTVWQAQQFLSNRASSLKIDKYILLDRLGVGGMGRVYLARDTRLGRRVAIKLLSPERLSNPRALARFLREAKVGAQLQHENLVRIYDEGEFNGIPYLVMELIEGKTLYRLFQENGPLSTKIAAGLGRQVALGLEHAYQKGLIHRDVNPMNIMVTAEGIAKLTDLGLALDTTDGEGSLTRDGMTVGTFDYISPEQARASRSVDTRSDIYSLGCSLYHVIAGKVPFPSTSLPEKLYAHQAAEPIALGLAARDVPSGLEAVIARMMKKKPEDRYPTPLAVAMALEPFQGGGTFVVPWADAVRTPVTSPSSAHHPLSTPENGEEGSEFSLGVLPASGVVPTTPAASDHPWSAAESESSGPAGSQLLASASDLFPPEESDSVKLGPEDFPSQVDESAEVEVDGEALEAADSAGFPVALRADSSPEFGIFGRPILLDEGAPQPSSARKPAGRTSRRKENSSRTLNLLTLLLILALAGGLIYRTVANRVASAPPTRPSDEKDDGRGPRLASQGGPTIQVQQVGGEFAPADDLRAAIGLVAQGGGEVVISGVGAHLLMLDAPLEISGAVHIRAEVGAGALLIQTMVAGPFLHGKEGSALTLEGVTLAQTCGPYPAARLIESQGELTLKRCLIWSNDAGEGSRAVVAEGPQLRLEGCAIRGYDRAVEVAMAPGAKASLANCLFVWSRADKRKSGWAVRVRGRGGEGNRAIGLDHCTIAGGVLDVEEGISAANTLAVNSQRNAVLADALLWWGVPPSEFPRALHWQGTGNRYDVQKVAWVVLPPAGFDGLPNGPDDPASWEKALPEAALIAKSFHFLRGDSGDSRFDPRAFALAEEEARGVGADLANVGPAAPNP